MKDKELSPSNILLLFCFLLQRERDLGGYILFSKWKGQVKNWGIIQGTELI